MITNQKEFGTPVRKAGNKSPSSSLNATPNRSNSNAAVVESNLRAEAPPFFISGTSLQTVVPLAGYFQGPSPYGNYSPYHGQPAATAEAKKDDALPTALPAFPDIGQVMLGAQIVPPKEPAEKKSEKVEEKEEEVIVSEEDWQRRITKRQHDIATVKGWRAYQKYISKVPREQRAPDDPQTPRADDRSLAKRRWKAKVEEWRTQVRDKYEPRTYGIVDLLAARDEEKGERPEAFKKTLRVLHKSIPISTFTTQSPLQ